MKLNNNNNNTSKDYHHYIKDIHHFCITYSSLECQNPTFMFFTCSHSCKIAKLSQQSSSVLQEWNSISYRNIQTCDFINHFTKSLTEHLPKVFSLPHVVSKTFINLDIHLLQLCPSFIEAKMRFLGNYSKFDMNVECTYEYIGGSGSSDRILSRNLHIKIIVNEKYKIY
jgi:hypothetical protein